MCYKAIEAAKPRIQKLGNKNQGCVLNFNVVILCIGLG